MEHEGFSEPQANSALPNYGTPLDDVRGHPSRQAPGANKCGGLTLCDLDIVVAKLRYWLAYVAPDREVVDTSSSREKYDSLDTTLSDFLHLCSSREEYVSPDATLSLFEDTSCNREESVSPDTTLSLFEDTSSSREESVSLDTTLSDFEDMCNSREESVSLDTTLSDFEDMCNSREESVSLDTTLSDIEMDGDADFSNCDMDIGLHFAGRHCHLFVQTVEHLVKIKHGARVDGRIAAADGAHVGAIQGPAGDARVPAYIDAPIDESPLGLFMFMVENMPARL